MNEDLVIVPIVFFTGLAAVWIFLWTRNKERMAMIERGVTPASFANRKRLDPGDPLNTLKWGLLIFGVGVGFLLSLIIGSFPGYDSPHELRPALMLVCGGAGLLIYYIIAAKRVKTNEETEKKDSLDLTR